MPETNVRQSFQILTDRLRSLRTQWRFHSALHAIFNWIGISFSLLLIFLLINQFLNLSHSIRVGLLITAILTISAIAIRHSVKWIFRKISLRKIAAHVEISHPEFENRLSSAVQLYPIDQRQIGFSQAFIETLIDQSHQILDLIQIKNVFRSEFQKQIRNFAFAVFSIAIFSIAFFALPNATQRLTLTFEEIPKTATPIEIRDLSPENISVDPNSDVEISAKVIGNFGAIVQLFFRSEGGEWQNVEMIENELDFHYRYKIHNISENIEYYVECKEIRSDLFKISIKRQPILAKFQLQLHFPKYTDLPTQKLAENHGDLQALVGTRVHIDGTANQPIATAKIVFDESKSISLKIADQKTISGDFVISKSEKYFIELTSNQSVKNDNPIRYTIYALPDQPPNVQILKPGKDVVLDETMIVPIQISVSDDFGVTESRIVFQIESNQKDIQTINLKTWQNGVVTAFVGHIWDLDLLGLFPEDVVSYRAEAIDAIGNIGQSDTFMIRFPSLAELFDEIENDQESSVEGLEAIFDKQSEAESAVDELIDKIRKSQELTAQDERLIEKVIESQKQIEKSVKDRADEIKQIADQMEKKKLFDQETIEKYRELRDLMEQALSEEHKAILEKLQEAMRDQAQANREQQLSEANFDQEQFAQQLDRLKELYKQLILQQKLEAAVKQAEDLRDRQNQISESLKQDQSSEDLNRFADREDKITESLKDLQKKLDQLADEMRDQKNLERVGEEIDRLNQFSQDVGIENQLDQASSQMKKGNSSKAQPPADQAAQGLSELAQGLDNALEFMEGANMDEAIAEIQSAIIEGLQLSNAHENTINQTKQLLKIGIGRFIDEEILKLQKIAATEIALAQGTDRLAQRLWELGKQQMAIDPQVVWTLNAASDELRRSAKALEDRQPTLATPIQSQGLGDLNSAIAQLLEAMENMNMQQGAGGSGLDQLLEQLQQLAEGQGNLNEFAEQLAQQMRKEGQTPGLQQMLDRAGQEQQMIREATERLAEMAENLSEVLGDLKQISEEMKEVEGEMRRGKLDQDVLDKQRKILTRMLESTKSLQKRETSKKRKGEIAKTKRTIESPPPIDPKLLKTVEEIRSNMRSGQLQNIPSAYRSEVERYFRSLSQIQE